MIPAKTPLYVGLTYVHTDTKRAYKIVFITNKVKINGKWIEERFISYSRLEEPREIFGRFEGDFKSSFTRAA
jgi:hypothetical protein